MKRLAILIANSRYSDSRFLDLFAPVDEAKRLRELLADSDIGAFNLVEIIENESKSGVERRLEQMLRSARDSDLVLIYFSGHGELSATGRLYLAASNSEADLLHSTAISATWINELLAECSASSTVIMLDCCYGGAFAREGGKSRATVNIDEQLKAGHGRYIMTATNAVERALDGTPSGESGEGAHSVFTDAIIRGLSTGAADVSGLGKVTPEDLGRYVRQEVPKRTTRQTPMFHGSVAEDVFLAWARSGIFRPRSADRRIHLGDLLGNVAPLEGIGLQAEQWRHLGGLVIPIGQSYRPGLELGDPVSIDLCGEAGHLLILGKQRSGKSTLLRTIVAATALTRSPDEAIFYCLESGANRLGSMANLRHIQEVVTDDQARGVARVLSEIRSLISSRKKLFREQRIDSLAALRKKRGILSETPHPDVFLVIDRWHDFSSVINADDIFAVANSGLEYGVHVIVSARQMSDVPTEIADLMHTVVRFSTTGGGETVLPSDNPGWASINKRVFRVAVPNIAGPEAVSDDDDGAAGLVEQMVEASSWPERPPWRDIETAPAPTFLELFGIADPRFDVAAAWGPREVRHRLRVPFGVGLDGRPVELDLKESALEGMGPHGLLVGATGSGKSELLRTLVLGLAVRHSSEILNFVLIDFKGGATFAALDRLPHTSAVITNLEGHSTLVDRMGDAIVGEIMRRQEVLAKAGNFASQRDYETVRAAGARLAPLPSLLIVVDEFSEMLNANPEFIEIFVQMGRIGRSIGMHLLLSSQRLEEGRLRGLDVHLSYRIGLRTFSQMESRAVLGTTDAYDLPRAPGHGYLKYGTEPLQRFKAAYVSGEGLLDVMIERMVGKGPAAHQVWLPPLDISEPLDLPFGPVGIAEGRGLTVANPALRGALRVPVALVDKPALQMRELQWLSLAEGSAGHVAIAGGGQSGKSQLLRLIILGLALTHTPQEVQIYCLDFGGGSLGALRELPHVGGVAGRLDALQVRRTVAEIAELLNNREARFYEEGIEWSGGKPKLRVAGDHKDDPYGEVFLVVDGWTTIRETFDDLEPVITEIMTRGLALGVHVIASTLRWRDFRPSIADQFGSKLELRLGDPSDSICRNRRVAPNVPVRPGFGVTPDGLFTLALRPEVDQVGTSEELVKYIAELWTGPQAPRVRMLPNVYPFDAMTYDGLDQWTLPIGLSDDFGPTLIDFMSDVHLVAFGESECGKSTLLRQIATSITKRYAPDEAKILIVDPRRSLLGAVTTAHVIGYVNSLVQVHDYMRAVATRMEERRPPADVTPQQLRERPWLAGRGEFFLIIDDYDIVISSGGHPLQPLVHYLFEAKDVGLHLITVSNANWSRAGFDPALSQLKSAGAPYLLMSADRSLANPFGTPIRNEKMTPGRARLVGRRGTRLVQLADLPAD